MQRIDPEGLLPTINHDAVRSAMRDGDLDEISYANNKNLHYLHFFSRFCIFRILTRNQKWNCQYNSYYSTIMWAILVLCMNVHEHCSYNLQYMWTFMNVVQSLCYICERSWTLFNYCVISVISITIFELNFCVIYVILISVTIFELNNINNIICSIFISICLN